VAHASTRRVMREASIVHRFGWDLSGRQLTVKD